MLKWIMCVVLYSCCIFFVFVLGGSYTHLHLHTLTLTYTYTYIHLHLHRNLYCSEDPESIE
jgi:hypothetical protein